MALVVHNTRTRRKEPFVPAHPSKAKDFAKADVIRKLLAEAGVEVEDTPAGPRWRA